MFLIIFGALALLVAFGLYWALGKWLSCYGIQVKSKTVRLLRIAGSVFAVSCVFFWRTAGLIIAHLVVLSLLAELVATIIRRVAGKYQEKSWYRAGKIFLCGGILPVLITCLLLSYGAWNMSRIVKTEYTISSGKLRADYDIVLITDTHYGTIQDPDLLREKIAEINALQPDLVILCGDIVEEGTSKEAMQEAFSVLGSLESTYGTYYIYGNHDRQHYIAAPAYSEEELAQAMAENGITPLSDQSVTLGEELVLIGREDAGQPGRASLDKLLEGVDANRFLIVADHQPVEVEENAALGVDLMVSGHTHGGQIFPIGYISDFIGIRHYGLYRVDTSNLIVSSGFTGWGFPIRTQEKCEYVVIHLS